MKDNFINVTAIPCNQSGIKPTIAIPVEFLLNISIIKAIQNDMVLVGGNEVLHIGNNYYMNLRIKK